MVQTSDCHLAQTGLELLNRILKPQAKIACQAAKLSDISKFRFFSYDVAGSIWKIHEQDGKKTWKTQGI